MPFAATVRSVNRFGATVPAGGTSLLVDGVPRDLRFDASGRAELQFSQPGSHVLDLGDGRSVMVHAHAGSGPALGLIEVEPSWGTATETWSGGEVRLAQVDGVIWDISVGRTPSRVLTPPSDDPIRDLAIADVDGDGVADIVAWNQNMVFSLRGLVPEGWAWAGGMEAAGRELVDAAVGDVNGDERADLVLAWSDAVQPALEVHHSRGLFRFSIDQRIELAQSVRALSLGQNHLRGTAHIDVFDLDGQFTRLEQDGEGFALVSLEAPLLIDPGAQLLGGADYTGDEVDDVFAIAPRVAGAPREIVIFDFAARPITFVERSALGGHVAVADADGDDQRELWTLDEAGALRILARDGVEQTEWTVAHLSQVGPMSLGGGEGDSHPDLQVVGPAYAALWPGEADDDAPWRVASPALDNLLEDVLDVWGPIELDGDEGTLEWVGLQQREGILAVRSWSRPAGGPTVYQLSSRSVGPSGSLVDAARCGSTLWVLDGAGLHQIALGTLISEQGLWSDVAGSAVSCVSEPEPWVAVLGDGMVSFVSPRGGVQDPVPALAAANLVLGPAASPGEGPEVWTCDVPGCEITRWSMGPEASALVRAGSGIAQVESVPMRALPFGGRPSTVDVDADGLDDLLLVSADGFISLIRASYNAPGLGETWRLSRALNGGGFVGDADGDGAPELFLIDAEGVLFVTP